jgi:hypothetical protein
MASLTDILGFAESVSINDQRFVGQVISRNQRIATSEILTVVPFQFEFKPNNYLQYSQNRDLLANLRYFDKSLTQYLNFSVTGWVNYIEYQGDMTSGQISACQWQVSSSAKNMVLGNLPSNVDLPSTQYIVKAGDFCQIGLYAYIATADVLRGTGSTVTIPVHRNLINGPVVSVINAVIGQYGTTVSMGGTTYTGTTFPVILQQYPQYTLVPIANDSFIAWNNSFKAFEAVL